MAQLPRAFGLRARSLVVVAPHPDDDVLGCGALIASVAQTLDVRVIYVTNGAASHAGSPSFPPARLRAVREREAARALRRLGVLRSPEFLRVPDGTVPLPEEPGALPLVRSLREAIPQTDAVVAVPWRRDPHCDHRAVRAVAQAALRERPLATAIEYLVWTGVIGDSGDVPRAEEGRTVWFRSGRWLGQKRAALREHRSQLGELVRDAESAFVLPAALVARALGPFERYVVPICA